MADTKAIVIGLDGATFKIIDELLSQGRLPHIRKLIDGGVRAQLLSTIPCATIPAWPSFITGKNPGKFGVFDFFQYDNAKRRFVNSRDIRALTLWHVLGHAGKRSIVLNVPCTYPPNPLNGILVSGMLTPRDSGCTHPAEIKQMLDEAVGGYRINHKVHLPTGDALIEDLREVTSKQKTGFIALLRRFPWDFAMMMFRGTDVVQHRFWNQPAVVQDFYEEIDTAIGEICEAADGAAVFLMSDHGFTTQRSNFHVNKWLSDVGLSAVRRGGGAEQRRWQEIGKLDGHDVDAADHMDQPGFFARLMSRIGITRATFKRILPKRLWNALKAIAPASSKRLIARGKDYEIDWEKTLVSGFQAYSSESKFLRVNLKGRDEHGVVQPDEYEGIRKDVIAGLSDVRDPETGEPVVQETYRREELYHGPYLDSAPDLILTLREGYDITNEFFADACVEPRETIKGCHSREGIFIACGNGIRKGAALQDPAELMDLMPTLLHYLGSPVPDDCDGRVLKHIFDETSTPFHREVLREHIPFIGLDVSDAYTEEDRRRLEKHLRSLGYL